MMHVPTSYIIASLAGGDNAAGTEQDPASLTRAKALAALPAAGEMPLIVYRGGRYPLAAAMAWTDLDSSVAAGTEIAHNDITEAAYSGISSGWYWGMPNGDISMDAYNTDIHHNKIIWVCRKSGDGGSIYTLGKRPGGRVHHNYIERKQWEFMQPLYADNGSDGWIFEDNVVVTNGDGNTRWLMIQYGVPKALNNIFRNNWYEIGAVSPYDPSNSLSNNTGGALGATALAIKAGAGRY